MHKPTGWNYYLGTAGRDLVCQDLSTGWCELCLPLTIRFLVVKPHRFLRASHEARPKWRLPRTNPQYRGDECPPGALFSRWRNHGLRRHLSCCSDLGKGYCSQCVAAPATPLMWFILISVVQGVIQPHPRVLGFCWCCLVHEFVSWEWLNVATLVMSLKGYFFFLMSHTSFFF